MIFILSLYMILYVATPSEEEWKILKERVENQYPIFKNKVTNEKESNH